MRRARIFTCDPTNAKDRDDALHITPLGPDSTDPSVSLYEVGVHIADVSHFVTPGTALDAEAAAHATSTYLVQRVIPMLPSLLCEELCSLNPGVDRLAFSVIWTMRSDGTAPQFAQPQQPQLQYAPWFGKTVIRSAAKLDYGTAQRMIDGTITRDMAASPEGMPAELWAPDRRPGAAAAAAGSSALPAASAGAGHSCLDVWHDVRMMHAVAMQRRRRRFAAGSLALHKHKLTFALNADGNPVSVGTYPVRDSNRVIEEFMLLANHLTVRACARNAQGVGGQAGWRGDRGGLAGARNGCSSVGAALRSGRCERRS
jgi:DIS3-like exonuclease 2